MMFHHGLSHTIDFHKEILRHIQIICMRQESVNTQVWHKIGLLSYLFKGVGVSPEVLMKSEGFSQGLLTICGIYKIIKLPLNRNVDTITRKKP